MRKIVFIPPMLQLMLSIVAVMVFTLQTFAQSQRSSTNEPNLAASVERAVRDYWDAVARNDLAALSYITDDGFSYDQSDGYTAGAETKVELRRIMQMTSKTKIQISFELTDLKVTPINSDTAVANYRLVGKDVQDGKEDAIFSRVTDVLVRRGGHWLIFAEHASRVAKPAEPVIPGLPIGWERMPIATSDRYSMSIDSQVRHSGKASASLKFNCGEDQDAWASLAQPIAADEYRGKRLRLSGWLKTADANRAGLWLRIDGEKSDLGFDNMMERPIRETTDWKMYSVVLDVPPEAKRISLGVLMWGKGQVWADDLKLEAVDKNVAVTNMLGADAQKIKLSSTLGNLPQPTRKSPVNLGFEEGAVH